MTLQRPLALLSALVLGFLPPLLVAGSAQSVTTTTGSAAVTPTKATAGQFITFKGRVSGGSRPINVYRVWAGKLVTKVSGTSKADGTYTITRRMGAMPLEYYKVVAPATKTASSWTSAKLTVQNQMQDIALSRSGDVFTAQLTFSTANLDGSNRVTYNAGAGRTVKLQQQDPASNKWADVPQQSGTSDANGQVQFTVSNPNGVYRALAQPTTSGIAPFPSFPVSTQPDPQLTDVAVNDPAGTKMSPMPDSGNGAAAKYNWWPAAGFWDTEQGEGLNVQGCTSNCTPWSEYTTGTGRVAINDGQIALDTGRPNKALSFWGDLSSTLGANGGAGWAYGRWEMRAQQKEMVPGHTPYTVRVSLVPAGTPDGTQPEKRIVLGQWTGFNSTTRIELGRGAGQTVLSRNVPNIQQPNWHDLAVEITSSKIVWLIDGNVVGQASGAATAGTAWVPRIEMIGKSGYRMDRSRGGLDWVRYFTLDHAGAKALPTGPVLQ